MIQLVKDLASLTFQVCGTNTVDDPCDMVVFECSFNNLMQEIWWDHAMDVHPRKVTYKWLQNHVSIGI